MLEIKNDVAVVVFIFLKHNGLCERLTDSKYFYTEESIPWTNFRLRVTPFACTLPSRSYPCTQFVKARKVAQKRVSQVGWSPYTPLTREISYKSKTTIAKPITIWFLCQFSWGNGIWSTGLWATDMVHRYFSWAKSVIQVSGPILKITLKMTMLDYALRSIKHLSENPPPK